MLHLLADENFNNDIVCGLLRRKPELDIVRIEDVGLSGADDPTVLEWSTQEGRISLAHDVATITKFAYERVQAGLSMPAYLKSAVSSQSVVLSKIFYCWSNVAWRVNGKVKYVIYRYEI